MFFGGCAVLALALQRDWPQRPIMFAVMTVPLAVWAKKREGAVSKSRAYALCGGIFGVIAILAINRHDILPGITCFLIAIACALRANSEWKRESA